MRGPEIEAALRSVAESPPKTSRPSGLEAVVFDALRDTITHFCRSDTAPVPDSCALLLPIAQCFDTTAGGADSQVMNAMLLAVVEEARQPGCDCGTPDEWTILLLSGGTAIGRLTEAYQAKETPTPLYKSEQSNATNLYSYALARLIVGALDRVQPGGRNEERTVLPNVSAPQAVQITPPYRVLEVESVCRYDRMLCPITGSIRYLIEATDELTTFTRIHNYGPTARTDTEIEVDGAEVESVVPLTQGSFSMTVRFGSTLQPGTQRWLGFHSTYGPRWPALRHTTFKSPRPARRIDISVRFPVDSAPRVWLVDQGTDYADRSLRANDSEVPVDRNGWAATTIWDQRPGRTHGIAWSLSVARNPSRHDLRHTVRDVSQAPPGARTM